MAYAGSVKGAQVVKFCDLCREENIKWRCIDCDQCICDKCKIIHLRARATINHQTISIAPPIQDVKRKFVTENILCITHVTKMADSFCETCYCLICSDCVSTKHNKHQFVTIESILDQKLDRLRSVQADILEKLQLCETKINELGHFTAKSNSMFDESITTIKQREAELKENISENSKYLQNEVEGQRSEVITAVSKIQQNVKQTIKMLENRKEEVDKCLMSNKGQEILEATFRVLDLELDNPPKKVEQFIPGGEVNHELFGSFRKSCVVQPEIDFKVKSSFITDLHFIDQIVVIDETSAWISCSGNDVVTKVNLKEDRIESSIHDSHNMFDMALKADQELVLSERKSSNITILTHSEEVKLFCSVKPFIVQGIHVTKHNDILVGVCEFGAKFSLTKKSQRAVIMYSSDGKQKHIYQYDRNKQNLFTFPHRIRTNTNNDILVIDAIYDFRAQVVCLDKEGDLRWIYKNPNDNINVVSDLKGITTTIEGHIIISDCSSNAIHMLSEDGDLLQYYIIKHFGILRPWAVEIDKYGRMWIGCDKGGFKDRSNMHIVKLNM